MVELRWPPLDDHGKPLRVFYLYKPLNLAFTFLDVTIITKKSDNHKRKSIHIYFCGMLKSNVLS